MLRIKKLIDSPNSVFIGHGYLQHAWGVAAEYWLGPHMFLIPKGEQLKDARGFKYGKVLGIVPKVEKGVGVEDIAVVVEKSTTNVRSSDVG